MGDVCSTHPDRDSTGTCNWCAKFYCSFCHVDVAGGQYCSIVCFTEAALAAKGKKLPEKKTDPLAEVNLQDPSKVLTAAEADPAKQDESSIMVPAQLDDATSILDMAASMPAPKGEESAVTPVEGRLREPTSILGMSAMSGLDQPPTTETPLPMVLPGTRRSTIPSTCVFHRDTPAVVLCSKCGDAICTLCIADEDQGGRCSPACRRDLAKARRRKTLIAAAAVAASLLVVGLVARPRKAAPAPLEKIESPAEFEARAREAETQRLEAAAVEEARRRVAGREKEEREKAEALASEARRAKEAEAAAAKAKADAEAAEARKAKDAEAAFAKAAADAAAALAVAEAAREKAEAALLAESVARAEASVKAEAARAAEAAAKAKAAADAAAKAEAELMARREAEAKAAEATRVKAEAEAKLAAEARAKKEAAEKSAAIEAAWRKASGLIREATPAFEALAEKAPTTDPSPALLSEIDALTAKLTDARAGYTWIRDQGTEAPRMDRRIAALNELLLSLQQYRARCTDVR